MSRSSLLTLMQALLLVALSFAMPNEGLFLSAKFASIFLLLFWAGNLRRRESAKLDFGLEGTVLIGASCCLLGWSFSQNILIALAFGTFAGGFVHLLFAKLAQVVQRQKATVHTCLVVILCFNASMFFVQILWISAIIALLSGLLSYSWTTFRSAFDRRWSEALGLSLSLLLLNLVASDISPVMTFDYALVKAIFILPIFGSGILAQDLVVLGSFSLFFVFVAKNIYDARQASQYKQADKLKTTAAKPVEELVASTALAESGTCKIQSKELFYGLLAGFAGSYAVIPPLGGVIVPVGLGFAAAVLVPLLGGKAWKTLILSALLGIIWYALAPSMTAALLIPVLAAAVQAGTPILYATLGEIITERTGVLNLGVEGMMMMGAFAGFFGLMLTGNPWISFIFAGVASALMATIHGTVCLVFRGSQVVSGLALTIFGTGLADYLGTPYVGKITDGFTPFAVPFLSLLPVTGDIFFTQDALVYFSYFCIPLCWFFLKRTRLGLAMIATGENPAAVGAAGLNPQRLRWLGLLLGGFIIGLGGAYLSLAYTHMWTNSITAGRGWIAVALVIFAFWRPWRAMIGAYLFGGIWVFQLRLQASGTDIPSDLLAMLPYLLTLVVLIISSVHGTGRSSPAALGVNLEPGD